MKNFLFPRPIESRGYSLFLLVLRIFFGVLMMSHGIAKLVNYTSLSFSFPDPLGVGHGMSLLLVIFGELVCSIGFIAGLLYRLVMLPMLAVMTVAFFCIHNGNLAEGELAFIYFYLFLMMYITGPGRYSVDAWIWRSIHKDKSEE